MTLSEIYPAFLNGQPIRRRAWDNQFLYMKTPNKGDNIYLYHHGESEEKLLKYFAFSERVFTPEDIEPTTRDWEYFNPEG